MTISTWYCTLLYYISKWKYISYICLLNFAYLDSPCFSSRKPCQCSMCYNSLNFPGLCNFHMKYLKLITIFNL